MNGNVEVKQNLKPGQVFTWGEYLVVYRAQDNQSRAECIFNVCLFIRTLNFFNHFKCYWGTLPCNFTNLIIIYWNGSKKFVIFRFMYRMNFVQHYMIHYMVYKFANRGVHNYGIRLVQLNAKMVINLALNHLLFTPVRWMVNGDHGMQMHIHSVIHNVQSKLGFKSNNTHFNTFRNIWIRYISHFDLFSGHIQLYVLLKYPLIIPLYQSVIQPAEIH